MWKSRDEVKEARFYAIIYSVVFSIPSSILMISLILTITTKPGSIPDNGKLEIQKGQNIKDTIFNRKSNIETDRTKDETPREDDDQ